jgi:hypothetical protein
MNLTKASPTPLAATNRLTDVFQKLEQGQPLAVRLAGNSTAGQAYFSDDPRSTWGFNLLGHPQKTAGSRSCFSNYVALLVTLISECKSLAVLGDVTKDVEASCVRTISWDKINEEPFWCSSKKSEAILTSSIIRFSNVLWGPQPEQTAIAPATAENIKPAIEEETPDHLEPATFGWTRSGFKARAAARLFSENLHGDY